MHSQIDKYMLEDTGMVKFDFLGQKTIAEIRAMIRLIKQNRNIDIDLDNIYRRTVQVTNMSGNEDNLAIAGDAGNAIFHVCFEVDVHVQVDDDVVV